MRALYFAGTGLLEALCGPFVGLQLWHYILCQFFGVPRILLLGVRGWNENPQQMPCWGETSVYGISMICARGASQEHYDGCACPACRLPAWAGGFTFFAGSFFMGARIACRVLPSMRGRNSMFAFSFTSFSNRSSTTRPSFVCAISRPRKKIVAFTLSPSSRKRNTWFFLV